VYAHASVGCLHVRPVIDLKTEKGVQQFAAIAEESAELVLKYGGAISGEHGDGLLRSQFQEKMYGPAIYNAFREIKRAFDPQNLFNPGKIVDAPPLTANLRYGPAYVTPEVPTTFDFSVDGGLLRAAELCSGVGECRKKQGTMCPSYQATRDETHSTRGRANALRLAITGQLGLEGFTDPAVKEVLDLCLECKACKSECPTNVDMARLKAEFLDQYYKKHGLPWRNWVFGNIARLSQYGSGFARIVNWFMRKRSIRWLNEKLLAIDRRRILPTIHVGDDFVWHCAANEEYWFPPNIAPEDTGIQWFEQWQEARGFPEDNRRCVLVFPDTFTWLYEPAIGMAAIGLLPRSDWRVVTILPDGFRGDLSFPEKQPVGWRCCGRPLISNGMLGKAVDNARYNVNSLHAWAAAAKPITACEPSCILTIKDDYPALLRGEERRKAEIVAGACQTFEEFMETAIGNPRFRAGPKKILVHGHCHQRSLVGMEPTLRLLRRIPGAEVIDLDAGCCGMAGSFGYEKEHYEISRLIGEQRLFPAIRQADADTVIVASGFSCRQQIQHFTGRTALHPAQLLRSLLPEPAEL
jgi:Fe-S oxidoreductase